MKLAFCRWIPAIVGDVIVNVRGVFGFSFSGFRRVLLGVFNCIFALVDPFYLPGENLWYEIWCFLHVSWRSNSWDHYSLVDGKAFMEWVGPAVLKAYQWQVSTLETRYTEVSDIYDTEDSAKGLSQDRIERLPVSLLAVRSSDCGNDGCSICLQFCKDFEGGGYWRTLPNCGHVFHQGCLDSWLIRSGSCPMCRDSVDDSSED
ncbi:hypothetical protein MLD38_000698 [Melastoma candidum]|uniref:Uncharacterized protein n=1 Tax=Melastoma candidum TaxID=119954 RepID=A0ACB9SB14_9MYRT|nr:hypothetical protein MLD38_000698 [Melastoma candidum]